MRQGRSSLVLFMASTLTDPPISSIYDLPTNAAKNSSSKATRSVPCKQLSKMEDKTFLIKFKAPDSAMRTVIAATIEIQGDHLMLMDSEGLVAALFVLDAVESWSVLPLESGV